MILGTSGVIEVSVILGTSGDIEVSVRDLEIIYDLKLFVSCHKVFGCQLRYLV